MNMYIVTIDYDEPGDDELSGMYTCVVFSNGEQDSSILIERAADKLRVELGYETCPHVTMVTITHNPTIITL